MIPKRREYSLSTDQPILQRARRRRKPRPASHAQGEADFWLHFDLEKFASQVVQRPDRPPNG